MMLYQAFLKAVQLRPRHTDTHMQLVCERTTHASHTGEKEGGREEGGAGSGVE